MVAMVSNPVDRLAGQMMTTATRCMWMRGGTSKGGYFLGADLPADPDARDAFLLRVMGSPDARQIDGMGGGTPLTSKVAIVDRSVRSDADIDYLFLQVFVDQALVSDAQNCGNILAGVGAFAIERGLVPATGGVTEIRIFMRNTGQIATASITTLDGVVSYAGDAAIDGVPGTAAAVPLVFEDIAGSMCGALLPTGTSCNRINDLDVTLIDNGMPVVVMRAGDLGLSGYEAPIDLEADTGLKARLEALRLVCGERMGLGDVSTKSVPKMILVAPPLAGGAFMTRSFIPHRCHDTIGVLAAISAATAALLPDSVLADTVIIPGGVVPSGFVRGGNDKTMLVEHPGGSTACILRTDASGVVIGAGMVRTTRKLFDGEIFS